MSVRSTSFRCISCNSTPRPDSFRSDSQQSKIDSSKTSLNSGLYFSNHGGSKIRRKIGITCIEQIFSKVRTI